MSIAHFLHKLFEYIKLCYYCRNNFSFEFETINSFSIEMNNFQRNVNILQKLESFRMYLERTIMNKKKQVQSLTYGTLLLLVVHNTYYYCKVLFRFGLDSDLERLAKKLEKSKFSRHLEQLTPSNQPLPRNITFHNSNNTLRVAEGSLLVGNSRFPF